jgi:nucleoid-associated protein YgaU
VAWLPGMTTIITSLILVAALFALPVLGRLLVADPGVATPAATTPEQSVMGSTSSPHPARRYTVRRGDTLRSIARDQYGDEGRWLAIYRANQDRIDDPDALKVGTTLVIP